jgi:hypothetical protein
MVECGHCLFIENVKLQLGENVCAAFCFIHRVVTAGVAVGIIIIVIIIIDINILLVT